MADSNPMKWRLWFPNRSVVVEAHSQLGAEAIGQMQFGTWPTSSELVYSEESTNNG